MKRCYDKRVRDRFILSAERFYGSSDLEDYLYDIAYSCSNFGYEGEPMEMFHQYRKNIGALLNDVSSGSLHLSQKDVDALQLVYDRLTQFISDYQKLANECSSDLKAYLGEIYYP